MALNNPNVSDNILLLKIVSASGTRFQLSANCFCWEFSSSPSVLPFLKSILIKPVCEILIKLLNSRVQLSQSSGSCCSQQEVPLPAGVYATVHETAPSFNFMFFSLRTEKSSVPRETFILENGVTPLLYWMKKEFQTSIMWPFYLNILLQCSRNPLWNARLYFMAKYGLYGTH